MTLRAMAVMLPEPRKSWTDMPGGESWPPGGLRR